MQGLSQAPRDPDVGAVEDAIAEHSGGYTEGGGGASGLLRFIGFRP